MNLPSFLNKSTIVEKDNPFLVVEKKYSSLLQRSFSAIGNPCSGSVQLPIEELGESMSFEYVFDGESLEVSFKNTFLITSARKDEEYQIAAISPARVEMTDGYHLSVKIAAYSVQHARLLHEVALLMLPIKTSEVPRYYAIIKKIGTHYFLQSIFMDYSDKFAVIFNGDKLILITESDTISRPIPFSPGIRQVTVRDDCLDFVNHEYHIYFTKSETITNTRGFTIELSRRSTITGLCELVQFEDKKNTFGNITYDYGRQIADYAKSGWELVFHVNKIQVKESQGIYGESSVETWPMLNPTLLHPLGISMDIMGQSIKERRTQLIVKSQYQLRNFVESFNIAMPEIDVDAISFTREGTTKPVEYAFAKGGKQTFSIGPGKPSELEIEAFRTFLETTWETIAGGKDQHDYLGSISYPEFIVEKITLLPRIEGYSFRAEPPAKQRIATGIRIALAMKNIQTNQFDKLTVYFDSDKDHIDHTSIRVALKKIKIERQESQDPRVTKGLFGSFGIIEAGSTDPISRKNNLFIVAKAFLNNRIDFDIPLVPFKNYFVGYNYPSGSTNTESFEMEIVVKAGNWTYIPKGIKTSQGNASFSSLSIFKQSGYLLFDLEYLNIGPSIEPFHVYFLSHQRIFQKQTYARSACYVSYSDLLADLDPQSSAIDLLRLAISQGNAKQLPIMPELSNLGMINVAIESTNVFAIVAKKHESSLLLADRDQLAIMEACGIEFSATPASMPSGKLNLPRIFENLGAQFPNTSIYYRMFDAIHGKLVGLMKEGILKERKTMLAKYMRECDILLEELKVATTEYVYHMLHSIPFKSVKISIGQDDDRKTFNIEDSVPMDDKTILEVQPISSTKYTETIPSALLVFKNVSSGDVVYVKLQKGGETSVGIPPLASPLQLRPIDLELIEKPEQGASYLRVKVESGTITFSKTRALLEQQQQAILYANDYELASIEKVEEKPGTGEMQTYSLEWSLANIKTEALVLAELRVARGDGIPFMGADFSYLRRCLDILNEAKIAVYNFNELLDITSKKEPGQIALKLYLNPDVDKSKVSSLFANLSKLETLTSIKADFGVLFKPLKTDIFNNVVEGVGITLDAESITNRKTFEAISNILFFTAEWKDILEGETYQIVPPDRGLVRFTQLGNPTAFVRMESPFLKAQRLGYMPMNGDFQDQPIDTSKTKGVLGFYYPVMVLDPQLARPIDKTHVIEAKFPPFNLNEEHALFRNVLYEGSFEFNQQYLDAVSTIASAHFTHVDREKDSITVHVKMSIKAFEAFVPRIIEKARLAIGLTNLQPKEVSASLLNKWSANMVARFEDEVMKTTEGKWLYTNPAIDEVFFNPKSSGKEKNAQIADFLGRLVAMRNQSAHGNEFLSNHVLNHIDPLSPLSGPLLDFHRCWGLLIEKGMRDIVHEYFSLLQTGYRRLSIAFEASPNGALKLRFKNFDIETVLTRARDALARAKAVAQDVDSIAGAGKYNISHFLAPISSNIELAFQYITSLGAAVLHGFVLDSAMSSFCENILPRALSILQRCVSIKEVASANATFLMGKETRDLFFEVSKPVINPFDLLEFNDLAIKEIAKPNILRLEAEVNANQDLAEMVELYSMLKQKYDGMFKPTYSKNDAETLNSPLRTLIQNSSVYYPRDLQFIQDAIEASIIGFPSLKKEYPAAARLFVLERNLLLPSIYNAEELAKLDKLFVEIKSRLMPTNFFSGFRRALVLQQSLEQLMAAATAKDLLESVQKHVEAAHFNDLSYLGNVIYINDPPFSQGHFYGNLLSPLISRFYFPSLPLLTIFEGNHFQVAPAFNLGRHAFLSSIDEQKISSTSFAIPEEIKVLKLSCKSIDKSDIPLEVYISKNIIVKSASGISELYYEYDITHHLVISSKPAHVISIRGKKKEEYLVVNIDLDTVETEFIIRYLSQPGLVTGTTYLQKTPYENFQTFFNKEHVKFSIEGMEALEDFPFDINTLSKNVWQTVSGIIITLDSGGVIHVNNAKDPELQILVPLSPTINGFKVYKNTQRIIERFIGGAITKEDLSGMSEDAKIGAIKEIEIDSSFKNNLTFETASLIFEDKDKKCFSLSLKKDQKVELGVDTVSTKGSKDSILYFLSAPDPEPASIFIRIESASSKIEIPQEQKDLLAKLEAGIAKVESIKNNQPELYENNAAVLDAKLDELEAQKKKIESNIIAIKAQYRTTWEYKVGESYSIMKESGDTKAKLIAISRMAIEESSIQLETFERKVRYLQWSNISVEEDDSIIEALAKKQKEALLGQVTPAKAEVTFIEGEIDLKLVVAMIDLLLQHEWEKPATKSLIDVSVEKGSSSINVTIKRSDGLPFKTWKSPEAGVYSSQKEMIEIFPKKYAEYAGVKIGAQTFTEKFSILRFFFAPISMEKANVEKIKETIIEYFDMNWRDSWAKAEG